MEIVNKFFPDTLSEDVYRHFGHEERPNGDLKNSVRYSASSRAAESHDDLTNTVDAGYQTSEDGKAPTMEDKAVAAMFESAKKAF